MKKIALLGLVLLMAVFLLSGCKSPEPEVEETPAPTATAVPTPAAPTEEPMVTPRPLDGDVEWPEADATVILIDPVDKPTPEPIVFEPYREYVASDLGISFEVPEYWGEPDSSASSGNTLVFQEPLGQFRSGEPVPASVTVSMSSLATAQSEADAERFLDDWITGFREQFGSLDTSSKASNEMLGEKGSYVTFWIDMPVDTTNPDSETVRMRGRCLVVPKNTRLYMVRYQCPQEFNSEYEAVYKKIRSTIKEL